MTVGAIRPADDVGPDDLQQRIDEERLDAAQREWERHDRVRRVCHLSLAVALESGKAMSRGAFSVSPAEVGALVSAVEAVAEVLGGEWMHSPKSMKATRAMAARINEGTDDATHDRRD